MSKTQLLFNTVARQAGAIPGPPIGVPAPGLVPWGGKGRSGTGVFAWCLSEFVGIEYRQPNNVGPTEVIKSTPGTMFIKIKGINPLKGIKK